MPISSLNAKETRQKLQKSITRREQQLYEIKQTLPKPNGTYLKIILGNVNVSILNKSDKYVITTDPAWFISEILRYNDRSLSDSSTKTNMRSLN